MWGLWLFCFGPSSQAAFGVQVALAERLHLHDLAYEMYQVG